MFRNTFFMSFDFIYDFVPFDLDKNAKLLIYLPKIVSLAMLLFSGEALYNSDC